jgi:hypothetical protein
MISVIVGVRIISSAVFTMPRHSMLVGILP